MNSRLLSIFAAGLFLSMSATALGKAPDQGKIAVVDALQRQQRLDAAAAAAPAKQGPLEAQPYQYEDLQSREISEQLERVSEQNRALVQEFEALLQKDPKHPDAAQWRLQIAEFYWQIEHYRYLKARRQWLASLEACEESGRTCLAEPVADYRRAIEEYRKILNQYPNFEGLPELLFRLGDALIRNQQAKEGIGYLHRLIQSYPNYRQNDAAYLALGEYYFSQKNSGTAQAAYRKIVEAYPQSEFRQYAQYKMAWTYINLADEEAYREAIALFKAVIEAIEGQGGKANREGYLDENSLSTGVLSFRNQALNDLSVSYASIPGAWQEAKVYLQAKLPAPEARKKLKQLGQILNQQGNLEDELALYAALLSEDALASDAWELRKAEVEALQAQNRKVEAESKLRAVLKDLAPTEAWTQANQARAPEAVQAAQRFHIEALYQLAIQDIELANRGENEKEVQAALSAAEASLQSLVQHYQAAPRPFDVHFALAYVLDERSDQSLAALKKSHNNNFEAPAELLRALRQAAEQYQKIIDWPEREAEREHVKSAANRQVFVYANLLASLDPSWTLESSSKVSNFVEEKRGSSKIEAKPLSQAELDFVRSVEQFSARYPEDEDSPAFLWRAAEIYRSHHHYDQAARRFDDLISHAPKHQYAAIAVGSMFELYHKAENYEKIEYWAKWLIDKKNFKHYKENELEDAVAYSLAAQAKALAAKGEHQDAVAKVLSLESEYPARSDLIEGAKVIAIDILEAKKELVQAYALLQSIKTLPREREEALARLYHSANLAMSLALVREAAADFEAAALKFLPEDSAAGIERAAARPTKRSANKGQDAKAAPSQAKLAGLSERAKVQGLLSLYYGSTLLKALAERKRRARLLKGYLALGSGQDLALYRHGQDFRLEAGEAGAQPIFSQAWALAQLSRDLCQESDTESSFQSLEPLAQPSLSQSSPEAALARRLYFEWLDCALKAKKSQSAKGVIDKLKAQKGQLSREELAELSYAEGRLIALAFEDVVLEFPIATLRKRIEEKAKLRQEAERQFRTVITDYKLPLLSAAAAKAMADMALHFRDAFKALPAPKELQNDPEGLENYQTWLEDSLIFPAEDVASELLSLTRQVTVQLQAYTADTLSSAQLLAKLRPEQFLLSKPSLEHKAQPLSELPRNTAISSQKEHDHVE